MTPLNPNDLASMISHLDLQLTESKERNNRLVKEMWEQKAELNKATGRIKELELSLTEKLSCFCDHCICKCLACKNCGPEDHGHHDIGGEG